MRSCGGKEEEMIASSIENFRVPISSMVSYYSKSSITLHFKSLVTNLISFHLNRLLDKSLQSNVARLTS